jgi:integrase
MARWVEDYLKLGIQSDNPETKRAPESVLRPLAEWWDHSRRHPKKITGEDLVTFFLVEAPFAGKIANRTFNQYWRMAHNFLSWCMRTKRMVTDLSVLEAIDRRKIVQRDFTKISRVHLAEMIENCTNPRDKALLAANVYNCARESELKALRIKDIDFAESVIHWANVKKGRPVRKVILRQLDRPLRAWLEIYLGGGVAVADAQEDQGQWRVFPSRIAPSGLDNAIYYPRVPASNLKALVQKHTAPFMGRSKWEGGTHTLRRSGLLAIELTLIEDGVDAGTARAVAQAMADHKSPETTDHYTGNSMQNMLARSLLQDRDILPNLDTVTKLRRIDGQAQAM